VRRLLAVVVTAAVVVSMSPAARAADPDPWIARDKAWHFDACLGIAAGTYALATWKVTDSRGVGLAIAGATALAAGAAKEGIDAVTGGDPSWKDFAWDAIGTVAGLAVAWGMDLLLGGVSASQPALAAPAPRGTMASAALRF
jgi:uncharacterized protein YfiM (DUF2279 family)